jgi:small nuclear ribonucleoprotein
MALQVLEDSLGKTVLLKLKGGKSIRGQLTGFDQHLNLVLEKAEDVTDTNEIESGEISIPKTSNPFF